ncbi:MAG: GHKL domain-containing protein [Candidatus Cloacimonetes bacterium]|nr:GHKL domain-containing protein [Candidatus Cloacimonadota bacterium]
MEKKIFRGVFYLFIFFIILLILFLTDTISDVTFLIVFSLCTFSALSFSLHYILSFTRFFKRLLRNLNSLQTGNQLEVREKTHQEFIRAFIIIEELAERLQNYETKLSKQKEGFNVIIQSIKEAIWIQNEKGIIRTYNKSFQHLVERDDIKDQYFWNVIRDKELYEIADRNFISPASRTEELNFNNKSFLCSTSHSQFNKETVFILYDITEFRRLETIKKDFILNVSHELRTPLTSIKGYLETIEYELKDEHKAYVEIIKRNTDRLINIVKDLLTLSRLEHDVSLQKEKVSLPYFLESMAKIFSHRLEAKNMDLKIEFKKDNMSIMADHYKFEQVFINLIDNALKHTEQGFIRITVTQDDNYTVFEISDSGSGIEEKHLSRLFERFYVVDKSRSRKMGGTGLGLSIVKHIVNLHNGTIEVESKIGTGTTFIITMPNE